ncbi:MAG: ATP-binding cassette domain-containing protein [Solirubrobacterales bacterium]|nr:ATP-binding cassette domain-containing protein [Solirubrobacterales bacterium]
MASDRGRPAAGRGGARVVVDDVRRVHGETIVALDGLSLTIEPGEFVALSGPSGSGKTSLLSLIGGLDAPSSGHVEVDGARISDGGDLAGFHGGVVGFVFQHHYLLSHLSAGANVELPLIAAGLGRQERRRRARDLLGEVGLGDRVEALASQLSGGERQRVAVARALANDPTLLLADEPTGSLDSETAGRVLELIEEARRRRGMTLLVVTYDAVIAEHADRVLHLLDGRLVDGARPAPLRAREQLDA